MKEAELREAIAMHGKSLFERGYTAGGSGNISARLDDGMLLTPTDFCLGRLDPMRIAKLDLDGNHTGGDKPSKEGVLHRAVYRARPTAQAVVHLHSPCAVAVSCLKRLNPNDLLPPITPYFVMRIGKLPLVAYHPPGDPELAEAVARRLKAHRAVILAHHGTVVSGKNLDDAVYAAEELEETARLFLLLQDRDHRVLTSQQVDGLTGKSLR